MSRGGDTPRRVAIVSGEEPTLAPSGAEAETMLPDGRGPPTPAQRLARGSTLGRYVVLDPIGKGGMGVVVSAYDPELDRKVAIKLLRWSEPGSANASRGSARLLREAQALAKVAHVNVVAVHDVGTVAVGEGESSVFVAMELLDGEPVSVWLDRERPGWRAVLDVFIAAGRGLAASHAAGVIHRDFKPENVRLTASGRVVVLDYGLARSSRDSETERSDPRQPTTDGERTGPVLDPRLTLSGTVMGTPAFMSPEQAAGHELDAATDQFSFCASLYVGLYGELPFGPEAGLVARAAWDGELRPPIGNAKVPGWLRAVLTRGLAREPAARFPTIDALLEALQNDPSRRRKTIARVAGLAAALGLCWWGASLLAVRNDPCERAAARIDETWTSARHDRVERALVDGSADAEYSARVVQAIDRYTDELREQRLAACRSDAEGARGDAAARVACLDRAHGHVDALVGVLEQPGDGRAAAALPAVNELPSPSECSDAAALRRSMPMPDDPEQAAEVAQLRIELSGVRTRFVAGDSKGASTIAQAALVRARALGFEPVIAEALVDAARAALNLADFDHSIEYAEEAYRLAEAHGVDLVTSGALGVLGILRTSSRPEPTLAAWMSRQHEALVHRLGDPPARLSRVLADRARLHRNLGEVDEAIAQLERAEALLEEHGIEDIDRVATLDNLGAAYAAAGRHDEAMAAYQRAMTIAELVLGPGHNLRVNVMVHLGQEHWFGGNRGRGLTLMHRALEGARRAYSSVHPNLVAVLNTVGVVMLDVDPHAALELLQEAHDDAAAQGNVPDVLRNNLALALRRVGRADEAAVLHRGLLDGKDLAPKDRARWHSAIAEDLLAAGAPADALRELETARAVVEGAVPPIDDMPDLFVDLARVQLALGRDADALDNAKRGVEAHERAKASALASALARYTLARALRKNAIDPDRQLALVREAQSAWATNAPEHGRQLAAALAFLLGDAPPL